MITTQPIIITPEQIDAIAAQLEDGYSDTVQCSVNWALAAEHWLRSKIADILLDVPYHSADFVIEPLCQHVPCQRPTLPHSIYCAAHSEFAYSTSCDAYGILVPTAVPAQTTEEDRISAPFAKRELVHEADGDLLWI